MKNKILLSILSILGIASILGLSLTPKEESPLPKTQTMSLAASTPTAPTKLDMSTIREVITRAEMEEGFEMGGFQYQLYSSTSYRIDIYPVEHPEEVKNIFLFCTFYDEDGNEYTLRRSNLSTLEQYTNVENVISLQNNCNFSGLLSTIQHNFDFYSFGRESMNYNYSATIDKFYICAPYETAYTNPHSSSILENLQNSKIKEIYFMDYTLDWTKPYVEDTTPIINSLGEEITISVQSTEDSIFSQNYIKSVCAKIPKINAVDFKATPYYNTTKYVIDISALLYKISDINPKLKSMVFKENYFIEEDTPELEDVIVEGNFSLFLFPYLHAKHLIYTKNPETVKLNNTDLFDDVRFILQENNTEIKYFPIDTGESGVITTKSNPFYIPEGDHPEYENLATYYLTKSHVQTYNTDDYTLKIKQFESDNGSIYYTNDESLSIDTLESYITEMTEGNFDFTTTEALDTQYQAYLETKPEEPEPTPSDNDDFVDESEFINGYQALGSIYYTSSKSLDDILKIASNYILQKDGKRTDEEKEVSLHVDGDTLSTMIKVNNKIVSSVSSKLHKLYTTDYGEFIYLGNVATFNGVLLFDTTSKTTKTPEEIYDYLLNEITNAKTIPAPDFKDFSLTTSSAVDISSSLIHTNGNKYKVEIECLSLDLSQAKDLSNPEITYKQVISPDDDKEDVESDYAVKTITKIYLPITLNASGVTSSINKSIITYKGEPYTGNACLHTTTSSNKNDGKDYSILMAGSLPDSIWYEHAIPVSILDNSYSVAFVLCEDNTIIVILPESKKITTATLEKDVETFITDVLKISDSNLKLSSNMNLLLTQTYIGSTYKNGNIEVVVSGLSSLLNASEEAPTNPTDKDKEDTPNNSTDKDKDKEENKNQSDVKDEGTSNIFNDFKDNFKNNKTFKTMSIILGTILGLVIIYVGYRIIKKIHKWLKK